MTATRKEWMARMERKRLEREAAEARKKAEAEAEGTAATSSGGGKGETMKAELPHININVVKGGEN